MYFTKLKEPRVASTNVIVSEGCNDKWSNICIVTSFTPKDSYMPSFVSLRCSKCHHVIRGCMFRKADEKNFNVCENCYRQAYHGNEKIGKLYKHCVLRESITKDQSLKICRCGTVLHIQSDGSRRRLFPVNQLDNHRGTDATKKGIKCGLLNVGMLVAEAKYDGMLSKQEKQVDLTDQKRLDQKRKDEETLFLKGKAPKFGVSQQQSLVDTNQRVAEGGNSTMLDEQEADEDIPFFLRKFTNKYPFGNVHMALRVGPLIIENGVEQ